MAQLIETLVDWTRFEHARASLGPNFFRVLNYFRDDGGKAVTSIEQAMRAHDAIAMIGPADLIKSEAEQMGAVGVAELAEEIEVQARDCVEWHQPPDSLLEVVVRLRVLFDETVAAFDEETNPLLVRKPGTGRSGELIASRST
jgi:hypothetical protein